MLATLAHVGFGIVAAVGLAVGGRLIGLWLRTRQLPELVFGCATLSQALAGIGAALAPAALPHALLWPASVLCLLLEAAGTVAVGLGGWLIFRRGAPWAKALAVGLGLAVAGLTLGRLALADPGQASAAAPLGHGARLPQAIALTNLGVAAAYGWMAFEALRYGLLMRRRLALGLDEPIVVHQFLLWGLACGSIVAINLLVIGVATATARPPEQVVGAHGLVALLGLVGAAALWGAFFTPRFYRSWAARGHEVTG